MALDFEKVKAASVFELAALALCEFSRLVDAIERIAPDAGAQADEADGEPQAVTCPHPAELRVNQAVMGQEPYAVFKCGVCQETVTAPAVEA